MGIRLIADETHFKFIAWRRFWAAVSVVAILGSLVLFLVQGLNYGLDFRGGTLIMAETEEPREVAQFRAVLTGLNLGDVQVTEVGDPGGVARNAVMMRVGVTGDDPDVQAEIVREIQGALNAAFPGISYLQVDSVGATISRELVRAGILAVVSSMAAILFYIWLRFEWQFSLAAVVALIHDVALTIGIFSLLQLEFSLAIIAAILTIAGYSLNDTVVVFDRVRENLRKFKKLPVEDLLDNSVNETLSRTIMTSATTLIALGALYFLGGEVIRGFTFAMIWGILVGTYSSIFVAAPILLWLGVKRDWTKPGAPAGTQFSKVDA
ncbi:protein translocase subunit SecF [soil metagenome]